MVSLFHSFFTSDDSYVPDWESHINKYGNLFYLEYNTQILQPTQIAQPIIDKNTLVTMRNDLNRTSTRRSKKTGSKLSKLINRHEKLHKMSTSKKTTTISSIGGITNGSNQINDKDNNKVKFNELAEGELKELTIFINPSMRNKFGRRTSVSEALLGLSICPFPNSQRIMIAGYMPSSEISQDKAIKIGDWLKAINDQDVTIENVDLILLSFVQPTHIRLQLKRIAVEEQIIQHQPSLLKITNTSEFVTTLKELYPIVGDDKVVDHLTVFSVMCLSVNNTDECSPEGEEVIFSYPPKETNCM